MNTILVVAGIVCVLAGAGWLGWRIFAGGENSSGQRITLKPAIVLPILGIVAIVAAQSFAIIPTGFTGVRTTFGQISSDVVPHGFTWKTPFVQSIELVNNKQQDIRLATGENNRIWGESSDKVQVYMADITVTYQINSDRSAWIFTNVTNYSDSLISNSLVASALKDASNQCKAVEVTNRGKIEPLAGAELQKAVDEKYGAGTVTIITVVVNDMNFEDSYNEAIAKKNIAQQEYEQAQIENKKNVEKAQAEADAAKIAAQGKADAAITEAEGQAEANKKIQDSITDVILKQEFYKKWNGQLPKVMGENQSIVDIGE